MLHKFIICIYRCISIDFKQIYNWNLMRIVYETERLILKVLDKSYADVTAGI